MLSLPPPSLFIQGFIQWLLLLLGGRSFIEEKTECMSKMTSLRNNVTNVYSKCRMYNEKKNMNLF